MGILHSMCYVLWYSCHFLVLCYMLSNTQLPVCFVPKLLDFFGRYFLLSFFPYCCSLENPKHDRFKNKDVGQIYDRYSRLIGDIIYFTKYVLALTKLSRRGFGMHDDRDSDQVPDHLPLPLESSFYSDDLKIGHSNASKKRSSKGSGKNISSCHVRGERDNKKVRSMRDLHFSGSNG